MSLSDYLIGQKLGSGKFGETYLVTRKLNKKNYAMKRINISKLSKIEITDSLNEIRLLYSLNNTNIIAYKEAFYDEESETLNIIMEYADDGDLSRKISEIKNKKLKFDETTIWKILIQILYGLKYLHENNIIHRDIKPGNIFLTKKGIVKIGDLNVSKILKSSKYAMTKIGTPYYSSPEIWSEKPYDNKVDIWSVGCTIYEMCCLTTPFKGTSLIKLSQNIIKGIFKPISNNFYTDDLINIVNKMIVVNPNKRLSCNQLLNHKIIIEKIKDKNIIHFEKGNKVDLISTILIPMRIANINNLLPQQKFNQEEEMLSNDLYESLKLTSVKEDKNENTEKTNDKDIFEGIPVIDDIEKVIDNKVENKKKEKKEKKIIIEKINYDKQKVKKLGNKIKKKKKK